MADKLSADELVKRGNELMNRGCHCGPATMQIAQEVFQFEPKATWAAINFMGGFSECQSCPCGNLSAGMAALGMMFGKKGLESKEAAREARRASRRGAKSLAEDFEKTFGSVRCIDITGYDFSEPGKFAEFVNAGEFQQKCEKYLEFVVRRLLQVGEEEGLYPEESPQ